LRKVVVILPILSLYTQQDAFTESKDMPGSLPGQPQEMNSSHPDNWTKVSYRGRSTQGATDTEAKRSERWLHPTSTSNSYTALLEEESDEHQKTGISLFTTLTSC
jgi:hypothetical protein